jgi:hypothetical protein
VVGVEPLADLEPEGNGESLAPPSADDAGDAGDASDAGDAPPADGELQN